MSAPAGLSPRRALGGRDAYGFPRAVEVGESLYLGAQTAGGAGGDVRAQTAAAFQGMVEALGAAGLGMGDLVNLRTYYLYGGARGREETLYWEDMTEVRLRYLTDPGPAATAVRVAGVPGSGDLIGIDGIASAAPARRKLLPADFWDWSMPVPFVQGWRLDDLLYLGGQISADAKGRAVFAGDGVAQTRKVLDFVHRVLLEGGLDWADLATLRICYQHSGDGAAAKRGLDTILAVLRETLPEPLPALTCFGVDLLYEGLVLEIDGFAPAGGREAVQPPGSETWVGTEGFPVAYRSGERVFLGGLSAPGAASLAAQSEATLDRLATSLRAAGSGVEALAKITVFYVPDDPAGDGAAEVATVAKALADYLPAPGPAVTLLRVKGLPHEGQRLQVDGIAHL